MKNQRQTENKGHRKSIVSKQMTPAPECQWGLFGATPLFAWPPAASRARAGNKSA